MQYRTTNARFAQAITKRMDKLNISIRDLAQRSDVTFEAIRKITKGINPPSRHMVHTISEILGVDEAAMQELAVADRIEHKYGGMPYAMLGRDPELALLQSSWQRLTAEQKDLVRVQIRCWADMNQARHDNGRAPLP